MEGWNNGSYQFVEWERMLTTHLIWLHLSSLPGKHMGTGCVWSQPLLLSAFGGPREAVAPQRLQEGTNYRQENGGEMASGAQLQHGQNSSRSFSQPSKHCLLSGYIDVGLILFLYLLLCMKPAYLCCSKTVEHCRGYSI